MNSSSSSIEAHKKQTSNRIKRIFDSLQTTTVYLWHRKSPLRWKAEYLFLFSFPSFFFQNIRQWTLRKPNSSWWNCYSVSLVSLIQHFTRLSLALIYLVRHFFVTYLESFQNCMDNCKIDWINQHFPFRNLYT